MKAKNIDINDPNVDPKKLFLEFKKFLGNVHKDPVFRSFQFKKDGNCYFGTQLVSIFAFGRNLGVTAVLVALMPQAENNFDSYITQWKQAERLLRTWEMCRLVKKTKNKDIHKDYRWYVRSK
jgi:hypothetical protein